MISIAYDMIVFKEEDTSGRWLPPKLVATELVSSNISHLLSGVIPTNGRNLSLGMLRFEG